MAAIETNVTVSSNVLLAILTLLEKQRSVALFPEGAIEWVFFYHCFQRHNQITTLQELLKFNYVTTNPVKVIGSALFECFNKRIKH